MLFMIKDGFDLFGFLKSWWFFCFLVLFILYLLFDVGKKSWYFRIFVVVSDLFSYKFRKGSIMGD